MLTIAFTRYMAKQLEIRIMSLYCIIAHNLNFTMLRCMDTLLSSMSCVQATVLCDRRCKNLSTPSFMIFLLCLREYRKKRKVMKDEKKQWMSLHRNNSFVNSTQLSLLCEKSAAILLRVLRQPGSDKILLDLKNFNRSHH